MTGDAGPDLNEIAVEIAATELVRAAGRPELYLRDLTPYEREAWRVIVRRVVRVYHDVIDG